MKITEKERVLIKTHGKINLPFFEAGFQPPNHRCLTYLDPATPSCLN